MSRELLLAGPLTLIATGAIAGPIRIEPLGDSITYGYEPPGRVAGGYRGELYRDLVAAGANVEFVGTQTTNPDLTLPAQSQAHEGHIGDFIDTVGPYEYLSLNRGVGYWLRTNSGVNPDLVLLMAGSNDIYSGHDIPGAPTRLAALITRISRLRPDAKILVSDLTPQLFPTNSVEVKAFNKSLDGPDGIVAQLQKLGENVTLVHVGSSLTSADIMSDKLHPTPAGYIKLGDAWFRAIEETKSLNFHANDAPEPSTFLLFGAEIVALAGVLASTKKAIRAGRLPVA